MNEKDMDMDRLQEKMFQFKDGAAYDKDLKIESLEDFFKFVESKGTELTAADKEAFRGAAKWMKNLKQELIDTAWMDLVTHLSKNGIMDKMPDQMKLIAKYFFETGAERLFFAGIDVGKTLIQEMETMKKEYEASLKKN